MTASPGQGARGLPEGHAGTAVRALRDGIRRRDVDAVQNARWLRPRPPGERDLLSDLAAAAGLEQAIGKLSRFWGDADVYFEAVRPISPVEAEVYERLVLPSDKLSIVSLVRRDDQASPWKVVCTNESDDDRFVLWISASLPALDDVAWTRDFQERGQRGELLMEDDQTGVLGHPDRGWLAHVRGPLEPVSWPETLPGDGHRLLELSSELSVHPKEREEQLRWLLSAAKVFLEQLGGQAALIPSYEKLVLGQALEAAAAGELRPHEAFRFWARVEERGGYFYTAGLRQLALPEVEAAADLLSTPDRTARLVRWLGATLLESAGAATIGTELLLGDDAFVLVAGRRGPRKGKTYGRWGAVAVVPSDSEFATRGSRTRIRVPDDLR